MSPASLDVPLALVLAAAAGLGGLQAVAYVLARRGLEAVEGDPAPLAPIATTLVLFAAGAATARALTPAHPTAATLGALAVGAAATVVWIGLRRHAGWRVVLAAPATARASALAVRARGAVMLLAALGLMLAVAALGTGVAAAVPGWAPVLTALALRPGAAVPVAALATAADAAVVRLAPLVVPGDVAGLALAAVALLVPALAVERAS